MREIWRDIGGIWTARLLARGEARARFLQVARALRRRRAHLGWARVGVGVGVSGRVRVRVRVRVKHISPITPRSSTHSTG